MVQEFERGPFFWDSVPALKHQPVDVVGEVVADRFGHSVPSFHLFYDVLAVEAGVGDLAVREEFHEKDTVGPHVALDGEASVYDGLGRGPLNREAGALFGAVLVVFYDPREAEVAYLRDVVLAY